jgi:hypothetical protein
VISPSKQGSRLHEPKNRYGKTPRRLLRLFVIRSNQIEPKEEGLRPRRLQATCYSRMPEEDYPTFKAQFEQELAFAESRLPTLLGWIPRSLLRIKQTRCHADTPLLCGGVVHYIIVKSINNGTLSIPWAKPGGALVRLTSTRSSRVLDQPLKMRCRAISIRSRPQTNRFPSIESSR